MARYKIIFLLFSYLIFQDCLGSNNDELLVNLLANSIYTDITKDLITAQDNVELFTSTKKLLANKIIFNKKSGWISASGNVRIVDIDNNIIFAQYLYVTKTLDKIYANNIFAIMSDNSLLAANIFRKENAYIHKFYQVVYTPCNVCRNDPHNKPTWLIKSKRTVIDKKQQSITHTDAIIEFFGYPIFYFPYLKHPDPTIKRQSGFLTPTLGASNELGFIFGVPYYWVTSLYNDVTITPILVDKKIIPHIKYRHAFCNGFWNVQLSGIKERYLDSKKGKTIFKDSLRYNIKTQGYFEPNINWQYGFDINRVSDSTYIKKYNFLGYNSEALLVSKIYNYNFWQRHYLTLEVLNFQNLQSSQDNIPTQIIFPKASYYFNNNYSFVPGRCFLSGDIVNLQQKRSSNYLRHFINTLGWYHRQVNEYGMITAYQAQIRADLYSIHNYKSEEQKFNGNYNRLIPKAAFLTNYPWYREYKGGRLLLTPIIGGVATHSNLNKAAIPLEDVTSINLDYSNLFNIDQIDGFDLVDSYSRFTYGFKLTYYARQINKTEIVVGRAYNVGKISSYLQKFSIGKGLSDYIVIVRSQYQDWLNYQSKLLFNKKNNSLLGNYSALTLGKPLLQLSTRYFKAIDKYNSQEKIKQLSYGISSNFYKTWIITYNILYNLVKKTDILSQEVTLSYKNECFYINSTISKKFYTDRDFKPSLTFLITVSLKNLGGFSFQPAIQETKNENN